MKKFKAWAQRSPLLYLLLLTLLITAVEAIFWWAFDWDFSIQGIAGNLIVGAIIVYGMWGWRKYEKDNNVTTTLYKDRKASTEA